MQSILLIEDSRFLRIASERALVKAGYKVVSTDDGARALQLARESRPDLILLDMLLPRLGGPEILRALKSEPLTAQIPVIVLSSLPQSNEARLKKDGAEAYFEKSRLGLDTGSQFLIQVVAKALTLHHTSAS